MAGRNQSRLLSHILLIAQTSHTHDAGTKLMLVLEPLSNKDLAQLKSFSCFIKRRGSAVDRLTKKTFFS